MLSRMIVAAVTVLVASGALYAQASELAPVMGSDPVQIGRPLADGLFGPEESNGYNDRWWLTGEYLLGYTRSGKLPPLVTAGPADSLGISGRSGVRVLLGGEQSFGGVSGGKFSGGYFLDACRAYAFEWGVFFLPNQKIRVNAGPDSAEVLARPFFDTGLDSTNARLLSLTGQFRGSVAAEYSTLFWGAEAGMTVRVLENSTFSFDQLFHFRYYGLEETTNVSDFSSGIPGGGTVFFNGRSLPDGTTVGVSDYYSAINRWVGGAAGLRINWTPGRWLLSITGRMGVGATYQKITVDGQTTVTGAGVVEPARSGLLTAGNQVGRNSRFELSFAPEVNLRLGYRVTDHISVTAGYQYLYLSNVARVGQQIQTSVNPTQIPSGQNFGAFSGPGNPTVNIQSSDFWMHGLTAGFTISF
jgi:hypothetical protein